MDDGFGLVGTHSLIMTGWWEFIWGRRLIWGCGFVGLGGLGFWVGSVSGHSLTFTKLFLRLGAVL